MIYFQSVSRNFFVSKTVSSCNRFRGLRSFYKALKSIFKNIHSRFCSSGIFPLMKAGAPQLDGACIHVQLLVAKPGSLSRHLGTDKVNLKTYIASDS